MTQGVVQPRPGRVREHVHKIKCTGVGQLRFSRAKPIDGWWVGM